MQWTGWWSAYSKDEEGTGHEHDLLLVLGRNYYRRELRYGSFQRTIALPNEVKSDETKTNFKRGILEVRIPKAERFGRRA